MQAPFCKSIKTLGLRIPGAQFLREFAKFAKTSIVFEGACFSECLFNFLGLSPPRSGELTEILSQEQGQ